VEAIDLEWTPLGRASAYRLTVTDSETGERLVRTDPLTAPRYALDAALAEGREIEAKLEFRPEDAGDDVWQMAGPAARIPVPDPRADIKILRWEGKSPVHRLVVADQTSARTVFDRAVIGTSYPYIPEPSEQGHDLVMRVHAWEDGEWDEGTRWRPLPLRILLSDRRDPPPPIAPETAPPFLLAFTIDTEGFLARQVDPNPETAVDELIFGDYDGLEHYGIGLHMDLLEHFGFRGTFFVDVLSQYQYGRDALQRTVDAIQERGHEVQLHVHDEHLRNADEASIRALAGDLANMDRDDFRRIFELGVQVFERLTGKPPIAYRAGGYRITDEHFPVLEEFGIRIDSSVQANFHARVADWMRTRTQPYWIEDLLELPPTWTLVRDDRSAPETRAFAPNRTAGDPVSRMPVTDVGVPRVATYVSHSCELMQVNRDVSEEAMAGYERSLRARVRPEVADRVMQEVRANARLVTGRLDEDLVYRVAGLLRRISDRDDARCVTLTELNEIAERFPRDRRQEPVDPVPVIDRPHGAATVTGTRVYSKELLEHLSSSSSVPALPAHFGDDAVSTLVNAEVSWEGKDVAVIGDDGSASGGWLERRAVRSSERFDEPAAQGAGPFDIVVWLSGFERCRPADLPARLDTAMAMLRGQGTLVVRVRTLGVVPEPERNGLPPLAELLFPAGAVHSDEITAWDATTFASWFASRGFRVAGQRRVSRSGMEQAALERFPDKLAAIPDEELRTAAVDFTLTREPAEGTEATTEGGDSPSASAGGEPARDPSELLERYDAVVAGDDLLRIAPATGAASPGVELEDVKVTSATPEQLANGTLEQASSDVIVCSGAFERIDPLQLQDACDALYEALRPGGQLLLSVGSNGPASAPAVVVGLLRSGFELLASDPSGGADEFRLLRPLELADIAAFSGRNR
jgi:hypothetical protein